MTTPSGKPPLDAQDHDSSAGPDSSLEPPTPRDPRRAMQSRPDPDEVGSAASHESEAASPRLYGTVVPYGGDDRTEEIEPVALDMPFNAEERKKTPKAPPVSPSPPKVAPAARDYELQMPVAQLTLSDLFDSVPSSAALAPPDPAAFSSSRPPPQASPAQSAVVALPSINVGAARAEASVPRVEAPARTEVVRDVPSAARHEPPAATREPSAPRLEPSAPRLEPSAPRHEPSAPRREPEAPPAEAQSAARDVSSAPKHEPPAAEEPGAAPPEAFGLGSDPGQSRPEAAARPQGSSSGFPLPDPRTSGRDSRPPMPTPVSLDDAGEPRRRSVPTLESVGNAAAKAAKELGSGPGAAGSSPKAARSNPFATEPPLEGVTRFPSDVPTSRPPDVMLSPSSSPSGRPEPWSAQLPSTRELRQPLATVTAPAATAKGQSQLPSIMLAADVEAEPDSAARRAMRAARATVRLELPPNFNRPGSPMGVTPAPASHSHVHSHSHPPPSVGHAIQPPLQGFANPRTRRLMGAALAVLFLFVLLIISLRPRTGSLVVTALGPGNRAVDDVTIFVDGKPLCDISPCRIKGLTPGEHTLRASASNLASQAEETVEISAGDEATYNIDLLSVAPEVRAGGMRVPAAETSLTLYVDGKRVGRLPQEVSGLSGGKHWIKFDAEDGSDPIEKSVNILPGETIEVEPKAAKRDKALVTIRLASGSEGAAVTFDDAFLLDFPAELELEPNSVHTLSATKPGYEDLSLEVKVSEGETEKLIDVALAPLDGKQAALDGNAAPKKARPPKVARKPAAKAAATTAPTQLADSTQGLLNISSVPPSQIILNGRPLGSTPKTGITVPGDSLQTIVFVHPKMGRRRAQKFVPAGKERTVSIRF